jgi:hypothetical protein
MKNILLTTIVGVGVLAGASQGWSQAVTTGGAVAGKPLAITGKSTVRFDQLPANVQQILRSQAGQGVIASVQEGTYSGPAYRVQFVQNGSTHTMQFTANGAALSADGGLITQPLINARPITFDKLPEAVRNAVTTQAASGQITSVMQGTFRAPVYDAQVQLPGSTSQHVVVTQSGGLLQSLNINEAAGATIPQSSESTQVGQPTGSNLAFKDLGWAVQKPMLDHTGYARIDTVQKLTMPDGRTAYRGRYNKDNQQYQITVSQDGQVISQGLAQ